MNYNARWYSPTLGVDTECPPFTQPDTIYPNLYNPQSLNRYSYVMNNPYGYTDPSGHDPDNNPLITPVPIWWEMVFGSGVVNYSVGLGGANVNSDGDIDTTLWGPDSMTQAPAWMSDKDLLVRYPGICETEFVKNSDGELERVIKKDSEGNNIELDPWYWGKRGQANRALSNVPRNANLTITGYSAGADSAIMLARDHVANGGTVTLYLIGAPLIASNGKGTNVLYNYYWSEEIFKLVESGVKVIIYDDSGGIQQLIDYDVENSENPNWWYRNDPNVHYSGIGEGGTNVNFDLANELYGLNP